MKMTADQLLKIAGIVPSTTLRSRLNEAKSEMKEATPGATIKGNKIYYADHVVVCDPTYATPEYMSDMESELSSDGDAKKHKRELYFVNNDGTWTVKKRTKSSMKEGMESERDSLEYQFGGLGKAFEDQIYTIVDVLNDDEEHTPSAEQVDTILNDVADIIADIARDITGEPAARRAVLKALGQGAQSYDDEGKASRQRQLDV